MRIIITLLLISVFWTSCIHSRRLEVQSWLVAKVVAWQLRKGGESFGGHCELN